MKRPDVAVTRLSAICTIAGLPPLAWLEMPAKEWITAVRASLRKRFS